MSQNNISKEERSECCGAEKRTIMSDGARVIGYECSKCGNPFVHQTEERRQCCDECAGLMEGCTEVYCPCHVPHIEEEKKCNCKEPHISKMVCHHYDEKNCHLTVPGDPCYKVSAPQETWEAEFRKKFVRDDGFMDKYYYGEFMADAILMFIRAMHLDARHAERKEVIAKVENIVDRKHYTYEKVNVVSEEDKLDEIKSINYWAGYNAALSDTFNSIRSHFSTEEK